MKTAVIGAGGVGGFLTAMLAKHMENVSVVARGERGNSIKEKGLTLESEYKGLFTVTPKVVPEVSALDEQDVIFICVKNYSLDEVCADLKNRISKNCILVPVMNGVDPADRVRAVFPENTVVDSLIYTISYSRPDFSICQMGNFTDLRIGIKDPSPKEKEDLQTVSDLLKASDIDHKIAQDIQKEIWRKYILNCAYNVTTARHNKTIGPLREDPETAKDYESLVVEAYELGLALGVNLRPEYPLQIIHRFYNEHPADASSSLQRDIAAGKQSELETFSGYVVRESERLGLQSPVSKEYYQALLQITSALNEAH